MMNCYFEREKLRVLEKADLSRKGSIDSPIRALVEAINAHNNYYTTSSCSGRTVVFHEEQDQRKKGCHWLLVSHDPITIENLTDTCTSRDDGSVVKNGYTFLKFEPFVLHVICRSLEHAQSLLQAAVSSGFRNSGITCGKKGKVMLAVRSTLSLEVPLLYAEQLLVTQECLSHLVKLCNDKFTENTQRIAKFHEKLKVLFREVCVTEKSEQKPSPTVAERKHDLIRDRTSSYSAPLSDEQLFCVGTLFELDSR